MNATCCLYSLYVKYEVSITTILAQAKLSTGIEPLILGVELTPVARFVSEEALAHLRTCHLDRGPLIALVSESRLLSGRCWSVVTSSLLNSPELPPQQPLFTTTELCSP